MGLGLKHHIQLQVPGVHNVLNALAAIGTADLLDLPLASTARSCEAYTGTGRRFELAGIEKGITIINDYAHHPTEIRATLAAARSRYPGRTIWAVWQPHTFSRSRQLMDGFASAFEDADRVIITEIFAAREQLPEDGFSSRALADAIARDFPHGSEAVFLKPQLSETTDFLLEVLQPDDIVLVLSAGDADLIVQTWLADYANCKDFGIGSSTRCNQRFE